MLSTLPRDQVFWYPKTVEFSPSLAHDITVDVVVIGGGMAGLTAAQSFHNKGYKVALLEKDFCGSGASGKSSGFITPNSELSLENLIRSHGLQPARALWEFVTAGVQHIQRTIHDHELACDYHALDTLVVANTRRGFTSYVEAEHRARQQLSYPSTLYTQRDIRTIVASDQYVGGLSYGGSFGISSYQYCQGLKRVLQQGGVQIYENTPVIGLQDHVVTTASATVKAEHIIVCADYAARDLGLLRNEVYHVQTFLMASAPLTSAQVKKIFPGQRFMAWDTDLVYQYYRLTGDNRLLLGGASVIDTYAQHEHHDNKRIYKKLTRYAHATFPGVNPQFEYLWPGLIGISKDLLPLAGRDVTMPSVYVIAAATGLPWAAALGAYSAEHIIDNRTDLDAFFSPQRHFILGPISQSILGTRLTFALSNFFTVGSL